MTKRVFSRGFYSSSKRRLPHIVEDMNDVHPRGDSYASGVLLLFQSLEVIYFLNPRGARQGLLIYLNYGGQSYI